MKRFVLALMLAAILPVSAFAEVYNIDRAHSQIGFKIRHFFSKVTGQFTDFEGTINFDPADPEATTAELTIKTASIYTKHEKRDNHLKSEDFFNAEKFPEITFKSTSFKRVDDDTYKMEGMLNMHGIEKPVTLNVDFLGAGDVGRGGMLAGFEVRGKLDRNKWDITWNRTLDTGAMLGDDVDILIDIEAGTPPKEEK